MSRKYGLSPRHALLRATIIGVALVALLAGCVPVPATAPTSEVPATVVAPTAAATAEATTAATSTTAPTEQATAAVTTEATAATTATAAPTIAVTQTVSPTLAPIGFVVQKADRSIQLVNAAGDAKTLSQATDLVDMTAIFPPNNAVSNTLYVPLSGSPGSVLKVDPSGAQVLPSITGQIYGLAVLGNKLAYSAADLSANPLSTEIRIGALDGTQPTTVYSDTATAAPTVLRVVRWSPDGKRLYFGKEPIGLGGYILFGGLTNIWSLDVETGQATELVRERQQNAFVCIDDLSSDASMAADHCNPMAMELIDVATGTTRNVPLPAEVPVFGTTGGARFSPDGQTLAFALARRNPDDEQGWVAIADVTGGASRLIATSPAKDYFSVAGFLDADTLILQSAGQVAGVWTVDTNGQNLQRLTDGIFLGLLNTEP